MYFLFIRSHMTSCGSLHGHRNLLPEGQAASAASSPPTPEWPPPARTSIATVAYYFTTLRPTGHSTDQIKR